MFRRLTPQEISVLTEQACRCEDWAQVEVAEGFNPQFVRNSNFSGKVRIGVFNDVVTFFGGVKKHTGIFNATIHNCLIGNNVYIGQIRNYIANYEIEDNVVIENVDMLATDGVSSFGNALPVCVLNETGGREALIYDRLSAHLAYIQVFYRHKIEVVEKISAMIKDYARSVSSKMGVVKKNAKLTNCRTIKNLRIGEYARLDGIYRVSNGTINSCKDAPVYFGPGVIADNFIVCSNSEISQGAEIFDTFVGQGCVLGKQYSAENSLFFANCQGLHGEACAIFAGPYTVTHHKSTLLIAGYYSFLNAGSGSNQSNHKYKLGPIHQGIIERGSKTASDSYILWPARIGAFTLVLGRHYKNSDTSNMPFSYLIESDGDSLLVPGVNLRSVGTVRDAQKWAKRDRRTDTEKADCINFKLLSPFTVNKILKAIEILNNLKNISGNADDFYFWQNAKIPHHSLEKGLKLYEFAVNKFIGNALIKRLENANIQNVEDLRKHLRQDTPTGTGEWVDLAGLIAPKSEIEKLLTDIETGSLSTLDAINERFVEIHAHYYSYKWTWATDLIQKKYNIKIEDFTFDDIIRIVEIWKDSVVSLDELLYADAQKEFAHNSRTGFGIDGGDDEREKDFCQVRGEFEQHTFVKDILDHSRRKIELANKLINRIKHIYNGQ